eukprot:scaffold1464_cov208-Skeletonema_marinoi.AAC.4
MSMSCHTSPPSSSSLCNMKKQHPDTTTTTTDQDKYLFLFIAPLQLLTQLRIVTSHVTIVDVSYVARMHSLLIEPSSRMFCSRII